MFKSDHIQNRVFTSTSAAMRPSTSARDLILCIDDEVSNLELRKLLLERAGYNVLACHSANAGLAAFDSMPVRLVLLDFSMPGLNGAQLAKVMQDLSLMCPSSCCQATRSRLMTWVSW